MFPFRKERQRVDVYKTVSVELTKSFHTDRGNINDYKKGDDFVLYEGHQFEILVEHNDILLCKCTKGEFYGNPFPTGGEFLIHKDYLGENEDFRRTRKAKEDLINEMYELYEQSIR